MRSDRPPPKVFISYKWEDDAHNRWVEKLAADLRRAGIEATLDRWEVHYGEDYYKESPVYNPPGPDTGRFRVLRGGSWFDFADSLRVATRINDSPDYAYPDGGFRCVGKNYL